MNYFKRPALACATVGIMAATLECVKLVLAFTPNVEAVTLFCALFGYCFGALGVAAAFVFVLIEPLIYGFGTWLVTYLIYWPTLAAVFALLGKRRRLCTVASRSAETFSEDVSSDTAGKINKRQAASLTVVYTAVAVLMTFFFGVLSSLVEVGLFSGSFDNFFYRFLIYYARGVWFYVAQIVTNLIIFPLFFTPMSRLLLKIKPRL